MTGAIIALYRGRPRGEGGPVLWGLERISRVGLKKGAFREDIMPTGTPPLLQRIGDLQGLGSSGDFNPLVDGMGT